MLELDASLCQYAFNAVCNEPPLIEAGGDDGKFHLKVEKTEKKSLNHNGSEADIEKLDTNKSLNHEFHEEYEWEKRDAAGTASSQKIREIRVIRGLNLSWII